MNDEYDHEAEAEAVASAAYKAARKEERKMALKDIDASIGISTPLVGLALDLGDQAKKKAKNSGISAQKAEKIAEAIVKEELGEQAAALYRGAQGARRRGVTDPARIARAAADAWRTEQLLAVGGAFLVGVAIGVGVGALVS